MVTSVVPDITIKSRRINPKNESSDRKKPSPIITKVDDIDIDSGIIPSILLKLLTTNQITTANNKNVWRSLFVDKTGTFITLTEWGTSTLSKFRKYVDVILTNYSIKQMTIDQYSVNYNSFNIELEPISTSKIEQSTSQNTIKAIGIYRNLKAVCNIKINDKDKKLISLCAILIKVENQKINNQTCLRLTLLDSLTLKDTIELTSWKISEHLLINHIYSFRNILIKKNGLALSLSSGKNIIIMILILFSTDMT